MRVVKQSKMYAEPTLINLYLNEDSQELHCYPFLVYLDRCARSYNTLDDLSNKVCACTHLGYPHLISSI